MILVFGGTGFIGKNLLEALHAQGRAAMTVSRHPELLFLMRHAPSVEPLSIEAFHGDPAAHLHGCRAVVYLASSSTPAVNLETPWREATDNLEPLLRVLHEVTSKSGPQGTPHFVFISSGGTVYGPTGGAAATEDMPLRPISPYGLGKKTMEAAVEFMARTRGLRATVLRPANPVGPWQRSRSQGLVGALMRAAQGGMPFRMVGDGTVVRDYFDVADLVAAILAAIDMPERSAGQTFNVGSGRGHSVGEMLALVERVSGRGIEVETLPARISDVDRIVLDIRRIADTLGWQPTRPLERSLDDLWSRLNA